MKAQAGGAITFFFLLHIEGVYDLRRGLGIVGDNLVVLQQLLALVLDLLELDLGDGLHCLNEGEGEGGGEESEEQDTIEPGCFSFLEHPLQLLLSFILQDTSSLPLMWVSTL